MRDKETAKTAIEASITGHGVFSTIHTNNAPETLTRLVEMGLDRVSFSEALIAAIAQRLVRKLCPKCSKSFKADKEQLEKLKVSYGAEWFEKHGMDTKKQGFKQKIGCKACYKIGYRGRTAIFEFLASTDEIKRGV